MVFLNSVTIQAGKEQKYIPLTKGYSALVDPEDLERFGNLKWSAVVTQPGRVYACRSVRNKGSQKFIYLHRLIAGVADGVLVDHANGNTLDNRRSNLREANAHQNTCNSRKQIVSRSGFIGVKAVSASTYCGHVKSDGRSHYTKRFPSPVLAAIARDELALSLHGEFAVLNFNQ